MARDYVQMVDNARQLASSVLVQWSGVEIDWGNVRAELDGHLDAEPSDGIDPELHLGDEDAFRALVVRELERAHIASAYERGQAVLAEELARNERRTRVAIEAAVLELLREQGEIAARFAEAIEMLRSVPAALEHGDRAEASRLLSAVADAECDITGDTRAVCDLFDELGLDDLANPELEADDG